MAASDSEDGSIASELKVDLQSLEFCMLRSPKIHKQTMPRLE